MDMHHNACTYQVPVAIHIPGKYPRNVPHNIYDMHIPGGTAISARESDSWPRSSTVVHSPPELRVMFPLFADGMYMLRSGIPPRVKES
jgi:hypothetical protein